MPPTTAFILDDKTPNLKAQVKSVFLERGLMQRTGQHKVENAADGRVLLQEVVATLQVHPSTAPGSWARWGEGEGSTWEAGGLCLWSVLLFRDGVFALLGWPRALQQLQHTMAVAYGTVCLDALRAPINIANCLPCLKPSLPKARHYRQAFNQTVQG